MKINYSITVFTILTLCFTIFLISGMYGQSGEFSRTKVLMENGKTAFQTIPSENNSTIESLNEHLFGKNSSVGEKFVLGGNVIWWTDDQGTAAIANTVALNGIGDRAITAWGLNIMRVSHYSDSTNIPLWEFPTGQYDPVVDISGDGLVVAATAGTNFYLLDNVTGNIEYQFALPDSFYASAVSVSRDGAMVVFLANAWGNSNTSRAYAFDLSGGSPILLWTFDVPVTEITNWAGVNFSASGSKVAITGRYFLYVLNSSDGSLIWSHFLDNTESAPAISGDGEVIVTADNSGFVQTWHYDSSTSEYFLLWQYRVPPGAFSNWASSVGISADGKTILAGSLIFLAAGYNGSIMCFDTYGDGTPKWVFGGVGDLVDNISVSDDGRVAAAVTWGDYPAHSNPDLLVFDVATGQVTFSVITPGSFFTGDISPDGKRVFAGGKAVHAREFGNGGRIYLCEIDLGGGNVSGNVNLVSPGNDGGVLVKAVGTTRSAITNVNGNYIIENIAAGTYTITAEKPGYNFGTQNNVVVTEGGTTSGINFSLNVFLTQPPALSASTNLMGTILLSWSSLFATPERLIEIAKMVGDDYHPESISETSTKSIQDLNEYDSNTSFISRLLSGVDSIAIYRSLVSGGPYSWVANVLSSQSNFNDNDVLPLRDYYYVINIFNDIGQSVYSNEALGQVSDTLFTFNIDVPQGNPPQIDGILSSGEWDDALRVDISDIFGYGSGYPKPDSSVYIYLKFDDNTNTLFVGGEDYLNPTLDDNEGFGLYFDDNNNDVFDGTPPFILEGNFWAYWHPWGSDLRFRQIPSFTVDTLFGAEVEFSDINGHLQGEVAIPMGFLEGYQLQVFGPDKIVGLGAFLIARQGGAAVFNGWWPQTMNTVFNPVYFGDVGIDVSLLSPPQTPSNIIVARQGEDLMLTWDDPALGLNNEPLPVPPVINIYRNGEFLTSLGAGIESYLDNDVYCVAWYEYQFEALIVVGSDTLTGPPSAPIGNFACEEPVLVPISYDDGTWEAFYVPSFAWEENKFAVRFTPIAYPTNLRKVETTVNGNDAFDFTIQADNSGIPGDTLAGPYRVYDTDPATVGYVAKTLPGIDPPEIKQGDFWVVINYLEATPGAPGVGVDYALPIDGRTFYYLSSTGWTSFTVGDLMITAFVSDMPVGVGNETELEIPLTFDLKQNYPNPFNPSTIISYQIPQSQMVTLDVYNALGQKVRTLVNGMQDAGHYEAVWDGKNSGGNSLSSGVYLYRITAGNFIKTMKMILLR
ncbi:MAG TPA: FlgD immunoglobulin-like domain containing protein [Ignavibacteriaceae bacterium]|nr:FlgD immunoglobulin-like domain containing protein [Ignavibacteriaceae bacterium]